MNLKIPSSLAFSCIFRLCNAGDLSVGKFTHSNLMIGQLEYREKVGDTDAEMSQEWQEYIDKARRSLSNGLGQMVALELDTRCYGHFPEKKVLHFARVDGHGHLAFGKRPQDAPILHFGGPLTMIVQPTDKLQRGDNPERTTVYVGTTGVGAGTFVHMLHDLVPDAAQPIVQVEFPSKEPNGKIISRLYHLEQRC